MKIEIYKDEDALKPERVLRLRLVRSAITEGTISLRAVDKDGKDLPAGTLLHIEVDFNGRITFTKASGVSRNLGLDLVQSQIVVN